MINQYSSVLREASGIHTTRPQTHILTEPITRIGRALDNTIIINSATASRYHAEIYLREDRYFIKHVSETNSTWLNGSRMNKNEEKELFSGNTLHIGGRDYIFEQLNSDKTVPEDSVFNYSELPALELDKQARVVKVRVGGKISEPRLTRLQWKLLVLLYDNQNKVCTRDKIIEELWHDASRSDAALDTHISNLRSLLHLNTSNPPPYLETIRGEGFKLVL